MRPHAACSDNTSQAARDSLSHCLNHHPVLRRFFIIFYLNFARAYIFPEVLADSAAIICTRPSLEVIHSDFQLRFTFNNSCFVGRWRCDAAR